MLLKYTTEDRNITLINVEIFQVMLHPQHLSAATTKDTSAS